jgi:hypothetical protein
MIPARYTALRTELAVILKDFSRVLLEELGADCPLPGDPSRTVSGVAVDEALKGWLGEHEAAVTSPRAAPRSWCGGPRGRRRLRSWSALPT